MDSQLPRCQMPDPAPKRPRIRLPFGSTDAHIHIFGEPHRYPLAATRLFEPPAVVWADYLQLMTQLGISRAVIVHSAVYGDDNRVTSDAIATAPHKFRGIAVLSESVADKQLEDLTRRGFRGFRVNLVSGRGVQFDAARKLAGRVRTFGWHVQFLMDVAKMPDLDQLFADFPTDVVIDHMGRPDPRQGTTEAGFQALMRLLRSGKGWSKISAPYRTSRKSPSYEDMKPFALALAEAAPDQLVWGTDWPHVMVEGGMPNDGDLFNQFGDWIDDESLRTKILVKNPATLYGFDEQPGGTRG